MSRLLVFLAGALVGAVLAQRLGRAPEVSRALATVNGTADEFLRAVGDGWRARLDEAR